MANINQIYTIINALAKQQYGSSAVTVTNTTGLIALGDKVLSSKDDKDAFMHALTDLIGMTIFSMRPYDTEEDSAVKHPFDYGIILRKIYVDLPDSAENTSWEIGEDDFTPTYAPVIKPTVHEDLFDNLNTFEVDVTVPDNILATAFRGETEMAVFIDAVFLAVQNRIKVALESITNITRASFIARTLNDNGSCRAINLLAGYNAQFGTTITSKQAIYNPDFIRYATAQINLWTKRMRRMSTLFNTASRKRHTPSSDLVLTVLDDFAAISASYLQSDTYHKELVQLPRYTTVPYWQGSGTDFSFTSISSINIQLDADTTVFRSGILAVAYDYQALGTTINRNYTETERNSRSQYTNYYNKIERGMFNDMSENGIVFYVEDPETVINLQAGIPVAKARMTKKA